MAYSTQSDVGRRSNSTPGSLRLLANALTTASTGGTHKSYRLDRAYADWTIQAITGTTKADKFILQGSLDKGATWSGVAGSTFTVSATLLSGGFVYVTGKPHSHIRGQWITKATTVAVNLYVAPRA